MTRDELLEEIEDVETELSDAEDRIGAQEAVADNQEEEESKAGDVMDMYRQMMSGTSCERPRAYILSAQDCA